MTMPEIHVHHRERVGLGARPGTLFDYDGVQEFLDLLRGECAELFSVEERPLIPAAFSVYDHPVTGFSTQTNDIIVRITLHDYPIRVAFGDRNAAKLGTVLSEFLNTDRALSFRGSVSVGISLVFAEIAWAAV